MTWNRFPLSEGEWSLLSSSLDPQLPWQPRWGWAAGPIALGQATQHALLSPSFLPHCLRRAGGGADPALSKSVKVHVQGHPLQSPAFGQEVFLHTSQDGGFYEYGLTRND